MKNNSVIGLGLGSAIVFLLVAVAKSKKASLLITSAKISSASKKPKASPKIPIQSKAAQVAEHELKLWNNRDETDSSVRPLLESYWDEVGIVFPGSSIPWSAAFISWVANKAVRNSLPSNASHFNYASDIKNGKGKYKLLKSNTPLMRGDIILRNRDGGNFSFENIGKGHAPSHADIITEVNNSTGFAKAIGGNKSGAYNGTVGVEYYPIF